MINRTLPLNEHNIEIIKTFCQCELELLIDMLIYLEIR